MPLLTKRVVDAYRKPRPRDYFVWDEGDGSTKGFGLRIWPSGRKQFVFQYREGGRGSRLRRIAIGDYGPMTVDAARREAAVHHGDVKAMKRDPARAPHARKAAARAADSAPTVADIAMRFLADRSRKAKPVTLREYRRLFDQHAAPALGAKKVRDVTRSDIEKLLAGMADTPATANNVHALLGAVFTYAIDHELRPDGRNPCARITRYPSTSPKRSLTRDQYAALGVALTRAEAEGLPVPPALKNGTRGISRARQAKLTGKTRGPYRRATDRVTLEKANPIAVAVLRFLTLSGWREGEALSLRRDAIDWDVRVARLADTKTGRSIRPLGSAALDVLRAAPEIVGNPYVFVGLKSGDHLKDIKRLWLAAKHAADVNVRLHDLRHSFTTVGRELGYSDYVIAKLVGHVIDSMTGRYGDVPDDTVRHAADRIAETIANRLAGKSADVLPFATRA